MCTIEEVEDIDELSIDELQSYLLNHKQKLNQQDNKEQALQVLYSNNCFSISQRGGQGVGGSTNKQ